MLHFALLLALAQAPPASAPAAAPGAAVSASDHVTAGLAAFKRRHYAKAEVEFRAATVADPQSAAAAYYLGYTYYKQVEPKRPFHPDKQKAAEWFAKAYQIDPTFKPVWASK
jgi:tetratricopeptide (TPR) repeat protein